MVLLNGFGPAGSSFVSYKEKLLSTNFLTRDPECSEAVILCLPPGSLPVSQ